MTSSVAALVRSAAWDGGVAGFQAQAGHVHGHVGAGLVDHADDADGHADLLEPQAVGQGGAADDLAERVGQRGHVAHALRALPDASGPEVQAVEFALVHAVGAGLRHVGGVGFGDAVGLGVQGVGQGVQQVVPGFAGGVGEVGLRGGCGVGQGVDGGVGFGIRHTP